MTTQPRTVFEYFMFLSHEVLWEEKGLADKLDLGPNSKVLDLGCGRGRVAHHIASYSGRVPVWKFRWLNEKQEIFHVVS